MTDTEHSRLAPSHSATWANCPGSLNLSDQVPVTVEEETEHSKRGTAAHAGLAACLLNELNPQQLTGWEAPNGVTMDAEDASAVSMALQHIHGLKEDARGKRLPFQEYVEQEVDAGRYLRPRQDITGHVDYQLFVGHDLHVIDYKHGYTHVQAQENTQLILYALGCMAKAFDPATGQLSLQRVHLTIIQPRGQDQTQPIRSWTVTPNDLYDWSQKLGFAAEATKVTTAPLVPGDKQCRWCRAGRAGICAVRATQARGALSAAEMFQPQPGSGNGQEVNQTPDPGAVATPPGWQSLGDALAHDPERLTLEQRVDILNQADMVRAFLKTVEEGLRNEALAGTHIPGWKLVKKLGNRAWGDADEALKKLRNLKVLKDGKNEKAFALDALAPRKVLTAPQALRLIKPVVSDRSYANIEALVVRPEGGPALVPESAPGTPFQPSAEEMFEKQPEETGTDLSFLD